MASLRNYRQTETRLISAGALFVLLLMQACSPSPQTASGGVLRIALDGAPRTVDPAQASSVYSAAMVLAAYETLFEYRYLTRPMQLQPSLAAGWPSQSEDGREVTIRLRQDARFAPDEAFAQRPSRRVTAHDVAYSILRQFLPDSRAQGGWLWRDRIEGLADWDGDLNRPPGGIEVVDDDTIRFRLTAASPQFLHTLATAYAGIVPPEADAYYGDTFGSRSLGSGPYQVVTMDTARAILVANPDYREELLNLDSMGYDAARHDGRIVALAGRRLPLIGRIEVEFIADSASRWISFDKGDEIQIAPVASELIKSMLSPDRRAFLPQYAQRFRLHPFPAAEIIIIGFNMEDEGLGLSNDPKRDARQRELRCAIRDAVSWSSRNQAFYAGNAQLYSGIIPPMLPEFQADRNYRPAGNRQAAVAAFARLASERGLPELEFAFVSGVAEKQNFDHFRGQLINAGYPGEQIKAITYATFGDFLKGNFDGRNQIFLYAWNMDYADADNLLQLFYGPNARPGANWSNYRNDAYDALYEQVSLMAPSSERANLVAQMLDLLDTDCAFLGTATRQRFMASHAAVVGHPEASVMINGRYFRFLALDGQ